jgi:CheY-like chemotaxis protein
MRDAGADSCDDPRIGPRVLIVDDHPSFRRYAARLLDVAGTDSVRPPVVRSASDLGAALDESGRGDICETH